MRFFGVIFFSLFVIGLVPAQSDTINRTGDDGKKYGYWIIYGKDKKYSGYPDNIIFESGFYVSGLKEGTWIQYYKNQNVKNEIEYRAGRPNGKFKVYYETGELEETGTWKMNRYADTFYRYYPNKKMAQMRIFNEGGKPNGWQTWYNEEGEIELRFYANNGVEMADSGIVCVKPEIQREVPIWKINPTLSNEELCLCNIKKLAYPYIHMNENGDSVVNYSSSHYIVKLVGRFKSSRLTEGNCYVELSNNDVKLYQYRVEQGKIENQVTETENIPKAETTIKKYNLNKQLEYDGIFQDGKFYSGKYYIYDEHGLLKKIEVYKEGKYVGNAPLN